MVRPISYAAANWRGPSKTRDTSSSWTTLTSKATASCPRSPIGMTIISDSSPSAERHGSGRKQNGRRGGRMGILTSPRKLLSSSPRQRSHPSIVTPTNAEHFLEESSSIDGYDHSQDFDRVRSVVERKDQQIHALHERIRTIDDRLHIADEQRIHLTEEVQRLAMEKREIETQLGLREQEIYALTRRCSSQEEKMKEVSKLKAKNRDLEIALDSVRNKLHNVEQDHDDIFVLRKQLEESEIARRTLQDRLSKVEKDHDSVATSLSECLSKLKEMQEEKLRQAEEYRRQRKLLQIEMEKQRVEHGQEIEALEGKLATTEDKVHQMERNLKEKAHVTTQLRASASNLKASHRDDIFKTEQQHAREIEELEKQFNSMLEETLQQRSLEEEERVNVLQKVHAEKVRSLEQAVESLEGHSGRLQSEKAALEHAHQEQVDHLEEKHTALIQSHEKELSKRAEGLEIEFEKKLEDALSMRALDEEARRKSAEEAHSYAISSLEATVASLQKRIEELSCERDDVEKAFQERIGSLKEHHASAVANLESNFEEARDESCQRLSNEYDQRVVSLETELQKLKADQQEQLISAQSLFANEAHEKDVMFVALEMEFASQMEELMKKSSELDEANREITRIQKEYESIEALGSEHAAMVDFLRLTEANLFDVTTENAQILLEKEELELMNSTLKEKVDCLSNNLENIQASKSYEVEKLQGDLKEKSDECAEKMAEHEEIIKTLEAKLADKEHQIGELLKQIEMTDEHSHAEISRFQSRLHQSEQKLEESLSDIRDRERQLEETQSYLSKVVSELEERENISSMLSSQRDDHIAAEAELTAALADKSSKINHLENRVAELSEDNMRLAKELGSVTDALEEERLLSKSERTQDRSKLDETLSQLSMRDKELDRLRLDLDQSKEKHSLAIDEMNRKLDHRAYEACTLQEKLEEEMLQARTRFDQLSEENRERCLTLESMEKLVLDLEHEVDALNKKLEAEITTSVSLTETIARLQGTEESHVTHRHALENELSTLKESSETLKKQLNVAVESVQVLKQERDHLKDEVKKSQSNGNSLTCTIQEMKKHNDSYQTTIRTLSSSLEIAEQAVKESESRQEESDEQNQNLKRRTKEQEVHVGQLETEIEKLSEQIECLETEIAKLQANEVQLLQKSENTAVECERMSTYIDGLKKENEGLRAIETKLKNEVKGLELSIVNSEHQVASLQRTLRSCQDERNSLGDQLILLQKKEENLLTRLETFASVQSENEKLLAKLLQCEVQLSEFSSLEADMKVLAAQNINLESCLDEKDNELKGVRSEVKELSTTLATREELIERMISDHKTSLSQWDKANSAFEQTISSLTEKLQASTCEMETLKSKYKQQIQRLQDQVNDARKENALKDDEIRDLRMVDLKDCEESITKLTNENELLALALEELKSTHAKEIQTSHADNKRLQHQISTLQDRMANTSKLHEGLVADLEAKTQAHEEELQRKHQEVLRLNQEVSDLRQQLDTLADERDGLMEKEKAFCIEKENFEVMLTIAVNREREDKELQLQSQQHKHDHEIKRMNEKVDLHQRKIKELESVLEDRSQLLSDMVSHNKELDNQVKAQSSRLETVERTNIDMLAKEKEQQDKVKELEGLIREKEKEWEEKIYDEQLLRAVAEEETKKIKAKLTSDNSDRKLVEELTKENRQLKDKVQRQGAFLQRKISQERARRAPHV